MELGQFKLVTIEKQSRLRGSIKESEKREREMAAHDSSVARLQQWMVDTKELTKGGAQDLQHKDNHVVSQAGRQVRQESMQVGMQAGRLGRQPVK